MAGSTKNANDTYSMILSKYQPLGQLAWETEFTVNDDGNVHVGSMAFDASGNILVVGSAYNGSTNGYDLLLVKFDDSGDEIWHRLHNGPANSYDFGAAVTCDAANNDVYVTGGAFASLLDLDAVVIRYDSSTYLGGTGEDVGTGLDVVTLGARHYIVTVGRTRSVAHDYPTAQETLLTYYNSTYQGGQYDGVITKIITNSIIVDLTEAERFMGGIVLAPNPCTDVLRIQFLDPADTSEGEVSICDLTGRVMLRASLLDINRRQGFVNTKSLPDGTYVLHISHPKGSWAGKFIKLK